MSVWLRKGCNNLTVGAQDKCQSRVFSCNTSHRLQTQHNVGHSKRVSHPQGELPSPQSSSVGERLAPSPLPWFHSAVIKAHNVVSQVHFQCWCWDALAVPLGGVYSHWSIHAKVDSEKLEWETEKRTVSTLSLKIIKWNGNPIGNVVCALTMPVTRNSLF